MKRLDLAPAGTVRFSRTVRGLKFFAIMPMPMLERILDGLLLYGCEPGERVCGQGEAGDAFFVVDQGHLEVTVDAGWWSRRKRVAVLAAGDCFGEMALLRQAPRNATVTCLEASRVFVLPAHQFQSVLEQNPEFAREIQELAATRQFELDHPYG